MGTEPQCQYQLVCGQKLGQFCTATIRLSRQVRSPAGVFHYNSDMYIVAIAWIYVTLLMALTEANVIAGLLSFFFYGLAPLALLLWLLGTPQRRRAKSALNHQEVDDAVRQPDGRDAGANQ